MATPSEVKAGLDDIADEIRAQRQALTQLISQAQSVLASLNGIPQTFVDVVATINGYTGANAFETVSKAELAVLTDEFVQLLGRAQVAAGA